MGKLNIGDQAPDFELLNQDEQTVKLSEYYGKQSIVLYFYPKDETPGCIKEACGFRDNYTQFTDAGAIVMGISSDSVDSHKQFHHNRRLPFQLLSDPDNRVRKHYGVSGDLLGLIPGRETFVISPSGEILHRFSSQFQIDAHIQEALKILTTAKH